MSKSRATSVSPASIVERVGADAARCYILFVGPPDQDIDWSDEGLEGVYRSSAGSGGSATEVAETAPARPRARKTPSGRPRADAQGPLGDREGLRRPAAVRLQHGDLRGDGVVNDCYRVREDASPEALASRWPPAHRCCSRSRRISAARLRAADRRARVGGAMARKRRALPRPRAVRARLPGQRQGPRPRDGPRRRRRQQLIERCLAAPNMKSHTDGQEIVRRVVVPGPGQHRRALAAHRPRLARGRACPRLPDPRHRSRGRRASGARASAARRRARARELETLDGAGPESRDGTRDDDARPRARVIVADGVERWRDATSRPTCSGPRGDRAADDARADTPRRREVLPPPALVRAVRAAGGRTSPT